jgi:hypothetical protein
MIPPPSQPCCAETMLHRSKFWTILHHSSRPCQCSLLNFLDHECLFRGVMLPHNAQGLGWGKPETRIVVRMSKHNHNAIRGVVAGSEPSFHELGANTSTLIGWGYCYRCQPSCRNGGSPRRARHWAEGNVAAVEPRAAEHPPQRAVCVSASPGGCGRACPESCPPILRSGHDARVRSSADSSPPSCD